MIKEARQFSLWNCWLKFKLQDQTEVCKSMFESDFGLHKTLDTTVVIGQYYINSDLQKRLEHI